MVEITYQMVLSTLQTIALIVGVLYYVTTMRNQTRARQVQTFNTIFNQMINQDFIRMQQELLRMEWNSYDDFEQKYGSDFNLDNTAKRYTLWYFWDGIGHLYRKGLIDKDTMYTLGTSGAVTWVWDKFRSIIYEIRRRYNLHNLGENFEWLVLQLNDMMVEKGRSPEIPETLGTYIPDQE